MIAKVVARIDRRYSGTLDTRKAEPHTRCVDSQQQDSCPPVGDLDAFVRMHREMKPTAQTRATIPRFFFALLGPKTKIAKTAAIRMAMGVELDALRESVN